MAENKTMDKIHRDILKKFHTLCSVLGLTDAEKRAIVESYGVESSRDMDTHDLINVCGKLSAQANEKTGAGEMDKLRKRVMAAIGRYLKATGKESNATVIKGIACRATGHTDFNKIPRERLRNLVGAFNNKVKDAQAVNDIADTLLMQTLLGHGNGRQANA
ncbi:hypothetical protein ACIXHV_21195 [Bacteroides fragilis]|jgi:hypothetical protein|uniref:hypothetical protein n=1 Tax=Bacteroides fragilis TaxID=817 RepID=UPI0015EF3AA5|nr:hypothetical protein [Bacteroides fragilis]MBA4500508.1 hypothetical protein [Bacteroides fragilis]DAQ79945.1 MAG TPA: Protein of unknown function (DUF1018) [Caudoviricetes sp.]